MANVEYRTSLARFVGRTLIFEGTVKQKEINVPKITRSNRIRKKQYKVLILDVYIINNTDNKSFICNHVNIFLNEKYSDELEVGDIIRFKGFVRKYKSYKEMTKNLTLKVDNYGISRIKDIEKIGKKE